MTGLLVATIQVSAILLVAFGLLWLLRKRTASLRHAVVLIAMACTAVVPVLSAYMPSWSSRIVVLSSFQAYGSPAPAITSLLDASIRISEPAATVVGATPSTNSRSWRITIPRLIRAAYVVYITGIATSLLTLGIGLLQLRWLAARAWPMRSIHWHRRTAAVASAYGLRRRVCLAQSSQPVLATWGIARPQILLPSGAEDWPEDRVRAVLLHELAHIRRNDWIVQVLAGVLRAIYWFNPLIWIACARMRQESEQACDDAAIQQGEDEIGYAGQLLTLARSLNATAAQAPVAPSMALRSTLKQRIASVLDPTTPHAPASRMSVTIVWVVMLAVTCAVAACDGRRATTAENRASPASALPAATTEPESVPAIDVPAPEAASEVAIAPAEPKASYTPAPAARVEPRSPALIAADILELVQSALADESLAVLDEVQRPITGLHHIQRFAQIVVDDGTGNPATQAANYVEIINALKNTATFASNVTSTPRGAQLSKQKIDQLVVAMREKAEELAVAAMPTPRVASINVSTPEHRTAISALDLAQTTLRDTALVGPRSNSWLVNQLSTLERAAQSVLSDDGASQDSLTTKLYALRGALLSISRNAENIARRPRASPDALINATELSTSVRRIMNQLDAAISKS